MLAAIGFLLSPLDNVAEPDRLTPRDRHTFDREEVNRMNWKRAIVTALLALTLIPAYVAAQEMELKATVVSKGEKDIKVKTKDDEKTILIGSKTKGIENAKEGSKVTIKYTEKDGQLRASEINPR
jgi:ABC-type uncharacterized transport system permease subunit